MIRGAVIVLALVVRMSTCLPTDLLDHQDLHNGYIIYPINVLDDDGVNDEFLDRDKRGVSWGSGSGSGTGPIRLPDDKSFTITETPQLQTKPEILDMSVSSKVTARFASTEVRSKLKNLAKKAAETKFTINLPEDAFISAFSMTINDIVYHSEVKPKDVAQKEYNEAKAKGQTAGQVKQSSPGDRKFKVSVTIEAQGTVLFNLTYQQLLIRKHGLFENRISIQPGQVVPNISVEVHLTEPQGLKEVNSTWLISDKSDQIKLNTMTALDIRHRTAHVLFHSHGEGVLTSSKGIMGDFIVTYDVIHGTKAGHLEVVNGYFVHYFSPDGLPKTRKNVVFVIDTSGSMWGRKIQQTKRAFTTILNDVRTIDRFNIVLFSSSVRVWRDGEMVEASRHNIEAAQRHVNHISATGGTSLYDGLTKAVELLMKDDTGDAMPLIIMLTDGQPTSGSVTSTSEIIKRITALIERRLSLFSIGFGSGVDMSFLEKLSLSNQALARKVYEDSSASLQMKGFYDEVANPLLFNINLEYSNGLVDEDSLTKSSFISFFDGTEITVAGKLSDDIIQAVWDSPNDTHFAETTLATGEIEGQYNGTNSDATIVISEQGLKTVTHGSGNTTNDFKLSAVVTARSLDVDIRFNTSTVVEKERILQRYEVEDFAERLWAYLTIKNLLDQRKTSNNRETKEALSERALNLSLKYHFVTPLTSLLVVKPDVNDREDDGKDKGDDEADDADRTGGKRKPSPLPAPSVQPSPNRKIVPSTAISTKLRPTSFADSDPHFMVEIPDSGLAVCFDINGNPGDVFNLLDDPKLNLLVSAYVIPVENEMPGAKKNRTYFGKMGVLLGMDRYLILTPDTIEVNNEAFKLGWDDELTMRIGDFMVQILNKHQVVIAHSGDVVMVIIAHRVKRGHSFLTDEESSVSRHRVDYLGFYIEEGKGFSEDVHGLIGQFQQKRNIHVSTPRDDLLPLKANIVQAELVIDDRKVPVNLMNRQIPLSKDFHRCWHAAHNAHGLIEGNYKDYKLPYLNARPLIWDI